MSLIRSYDMGQRTQSLTLAGIMFLSVLAGMLMFDLDSTTAVSYTHLTLPTSHGV